MKTLLAVVPLTLAVATPALAGPFDGPPRPHHGPLDADRVMEKADHALDEVDATEEQRTQVRQLVEETIPVMQSYREEAGQLRDEIRGIFHAETVDRDALEVARGGVVDLFDRATATMFAALADLSEIFSVEQKEELRQLREERREAFRKRFGQAG